MGYMMITNNNNHATNDGNEINDSSKHLGCNTVLPKVALFNDHACTATRILEKRRQLSDVQEALETRKEHFYQQTEVFQRRECMLREKDLRLQESLVKFDKFLKDNETKRARAMKRYVDEGKQCEVKEKELLVLQDVLDSKTNEEKEIKKKLEENTKYQEYLGSVVKYVEVLSDDFRDIQEILDRYDMLKSANDDLWNKQRQDLKKHDQSRERYLLFMKCNGDKMLNMNNEIAGLQNKLEKLPVASHSSSDQEKNSYYIVRKQIQSIGQISFAIDNILERFESQPHHTDHEKEQRKNSRLKHLTINEGKESIGMRRNRCIKNLEKIANYMRDFGDIVETYEKKNSS